MSTLRIALPKGRMYDSIVDLLRGAGITVRIGARGYRPTLGLDDVETKLLKPQNVIEMLANGSRDVGFAGADWVAELEADLVELLDTGLDPVRLVAAAPTTLLVDGKLPRGRTLRIASEYDRLTHTWIEGEGIDALYVRSHGATEVFPPEDADLIVDNTATGATLAANQLEIIGELMRSSTRLYASPQAMKDPEKRARIDDLRLVVRSVLDARARVMVEVNVAPEKLEAVVDVLPCMREPTISQLHGGGGFAVKAAVRRNELPTAIPAIKAAGGTDVIVTALSQLVP